MNSPRVRPQDLPLLVFGPLSAFLATLVTRGRVLVAMVAGVGDLMEERVVLR